MRKGPYIAVGTGANVVDAVVVATVPSGPTSTIDYFWATTSLRTAYYSLEYRGKLDHYLQVLEVYTSGPPLQQTQLEGWNWKMIEESRVKAEAALLPLAMGMEDPGP
jgi:hypothetical protein